VGEGTDIPGIYRREEEIRIERWKFRLKMERDLERSGLAKIDLSRNWAILS